MKKIGFVINGLRPRLNRTEKFDIVMANKMVQTDGFELSQAISNLLYEQWIIYRTTMFVRTEFGSLRFLFRVDEAIKIS